MVFTKRQAAAVNKIIMEEVQGVLKGRGTRDKHLARANVIQEAIEHKQWGMPEPMGEAFGSFDVDLKGGSEDEDGHHVMMPHNFEAAHEELFYQALQPVVDEFVSSLMEMYEAGFAPEGHDAAREDLENTAEEMREELMKVIAKWTDEGIDRIV